MKHKIKRVVLVIIYIVVGIFLGLYLKTDREFYEPLSINKMKETSIKVKNLKAEIKRGAENLGWELDELIEKTLLAMQDREDLIENSLKNELSS